MAQQNTSPNIPCTGGQWLAGRKILVAEDNDINRQVISQILETAAVRVCTARNGQEAVDMVDRSFSALLMDVEMPVLDGLAATRRIRQRQDVAHIPIIAMTGYDHESDRQRCLRAGMAGFLVKPLDAETLFKALHRCLQPTSPEEPLPDQQATSSPLLLNSKNGIAGLAGNHDLYREILIDFSRIHGQVPQQINQALAGGNNGEAHRITHQLKGVAGTIKAEMLAQQAHQLASLLKEEHIEPGQVRVHMSQLEKIFAETKKAISNFLAKGK